MRTIVAAIVLLAVPFGVQAKITPQRAPDTGGLPGIVERGPPGSTRVPGIVQIRVREIDPVVRSDLRDAREQIERRRENGELSRREARKLRREVRRIARISERYGRDGYSEGERRELQVRASEVSARSSAPRPQQASLRP